MIAQKNVTHLVIGKDLNILAADSDINTLTAGQIAAREVGNTKSFTGAATNKRFQILYRKTDGNIIESPVIDFSKITNKKYVDYAAPVQRVRYIGYNGTSGTIDDAANTEYVASVSMKFTKEMLGRTSEFKFAEYQSGATTNQGKVAAGIVASWIDQFDFESLDYMSFERLCDNAGAAIATIGNLVVSKGDNVIGATDADNGLAVGDGLRIGGTTTASPVYIVTAIDATNNLITLDIPYQGASGTVLNANVELITAANVATAAWGVKLSANPIPTEEGLFFFDQMDFEIQMRDGWGDTTVSDGANISRGSGSFAEIQTLEYFLKGNRGEAYRVADFPVNKVYEADPAKTYDIVSVEYYNETIEHIGRLTRPQTLMIVLEDQSSGNIHASLKTLFGIS